MSHWSLSIANSENLGSLFLTFQANTCLMRKLIARFAVSLDGYIEGPNGEYDWIIYDKEQYKEFAEHWERTDAMFYGRKTYEVVAKQGQSNIQSNLFAHMKHYVFS